MNDVRTLDTLLPGSPAVVHSVQTPEDADTRSLLALGLSPGAEFVLEQGQPAFVVRTSGGRVAMERRVARCILIYSKP
ncbi:MAG: FeoA family protein [Elusimicrobiota bacterium]|jgi:Fe2+ transport system protein FeoA